MKKGLAGICLVWLGSVTFLATGAAQSPPGDAPRFSSSGKLERPEDYREWVYLTTGLGMTYGPVGTAGPRMFDNVFVTRTAYSRFMQTGTWPEGTMFVLEVRRALDNVSINNGGQTQGDIVAIEVEVKDSARFKENGWGYFNFGGGSTLAKETAVLPNTASCYSCHRQNTAVENTFVQFYPTLMGVAQRLGTVKPTYDPNHKVTR